MENNDTTIYGIKNCDTMKKAFKWLETHAVNYNFHDYKKESVDESILTKSINECGWENVINRRGTTWRKLPEDIQNNMNSQQAVKIAIENPSVIKRPLLIHKDRVYLGFKEDIYKEIFKT